MTTRTRPRVVDVQPTDLPQPSWLEVRCKNPVVKVYGNERKAKQCNALLVKVYDGSGQSKCWKCNKVTNWEVVR